MEAVHHRLLGGAAVVLALVLVHDLDHPFEREDAVEPRRRCVEASRKAIDGREHRREHRLVYLDHGRHAFALGGQRAVDGAAREHLAGTVARRHFDRVPPGRQP